MAKRKRTVRREEDKATSKLAKDLERLWRIEPGATAARAIPLASSSEVEVRARGLRCPVCQGEVRLLAHTAETIEGARLRVAAVECSVCRRGRSLYFRLAGAVLN